MPSIEVNEVTGGFSLSTLCGHPVDEETLEVDYTVEVLVGCEGCYARVIGEHLQAHIDSPEDIDRPLAFYENWAVIGRQPVQV